uniref:Uncharacterized protein n=1 Tax=Parastrongyloides trichosuri TaxID=131310 RepID=A0A0N4ZW84_PARTI
MVTTIRRTKFLILILFLILIQQNNSFKLFDFFNFNGKETTKSEQILPSSQTELLNETITTIGEAEVPETTANDVMVVVTTSSTITNDKSQNESVINSDFNDNNQDETANTIEITTTSSSIEESSNITDIDTSNNNNNNNETVIIKENLNATTMFTIIHEEEQLMGMTKNISNDGSVITTMDTLESSGQQYSVSCR